MHLVTYAPERYNQAGGAPVVTEFTATLPRLAGDVWHIAAVWDAVESPVSGSGLGAGNFGLIGI